MWHWMLVSAAMAVSAAGISQQVNPPAPSGTETLDYSPDSLDRMTVPVIVDGHGPFRFIVDTGAERTVISRELADRLSLDASSNVRLASVADVQTVATVMIPRLGVGRRSVDDIQAPTLSQHNLGADGLLGVDGLRNQLVLFDFENQQMWLSRSEPPNQSRTGTRVDSLPPGTIVVTARSRLGRLILADARVDGQRVWAIIDTGSAVSVGNNLLRERLLRRGRIQTPVPVELTSVTGAKVIMNYSRTGRIQLGQAQITDLPIAFADVQLFRELGLDNRPALLIGMDALRLFRRVSIDFATRRVRFTPGPSGGFNAPLRVAAAR